MHNQTRFFLLEISKEQDMQFLCRFRQALWSYFLAIILWNPKDLSDYGLTRGVPIGKSTYSYLDLASMILVSGQHKHDDNPQGTLLLCDVYTSLHYLEVLKVDQALLCGDVYDNCVHDSLLSMSLISLGSIIDKY